MAVDEDAVITVEPMKNRDEWQGFVRSCPHGTIFHTLEWLEVLERSFGVEPLCLVLRKPDREMVGLCPFVLWKELKFVKVADSLKNSDFGGPLFREGYEAAASEALLNHLRHLARSSGLAYARMRFSSKTLSQYFKVGGYREDTSLGTMSLDLCTRPPDVIWNELFDGSTRKKIKAVYRDGYRVEMARGPDDVRTFYGLYYENMNRIGVDAYPLGFFQDLYQSMYPDRFNIMLLEGDQETIAALAFFAHEPGKTVYTNYVGYRKSRYSIADFLAWELIGWAQRNGFRYFNRGSTPSDPQNMLHKQKASIGAEFNQDYIVRIPLRRMGFLAREVLVTAGKAVLPRLPKGIRQKVVGEAMR